MSTTIIPFLAVWLGLNVTFVAIRFYVTAELPSGAEPDMIGYPTVLNN